MEALTLSHSSTDPAWSRRGNAGWGRALIWVALVLISVSILGSTAALAREPASIATSPVGAAHFVVVVAVQPNVTYSNATVLLRAWVTGNAVPQSNVTVSFSSNGGGTFSPSTASSGTKGEVNTSFKAPGVGSTQNLVLTASAAATGSGFLPGSGTGNLTVKPSGPFLVVTPSFPQGTSVHSAASALIVARVTSNTGAAVADANVILGSTQGTVTPSVDVSGPSGNVTFTLRTPNVTSATQDVLLFVANETGYANGSSIASVTVNSGVAASLYVTVNPASGNLAPGQSARLTVTIRSTNATGPLVSGANVSLILSDGTYSPATVVTGSQGTANLTFVAPTTLPKSENVTVTVSASATNYAGGSATATFVVAKGSPAGAASSLWLWVLLGVIVAIVLGIGIYFATRRRRPPPSVREVPAVNPPTGTGGTGTAPPPQ
jgi:hypothetical protein